MLRRNSPKEKVSSKESIIREMTVSDLSQVLFIERLSFRPPWSKRIFLEELTISAREYFVLEIQKKIIGYAGLSFILDEAHITTLAIHPRFRRKGFGELLLRFLIARARERGAAILTLEVRESNRAAQNLYKKFGFREVGKRRKYYLFPAEDAVIMSLILKENLRL